MPEHCLLFRRRAHDRVAERAFGRSAAVLVIVGVAAVVGRCGHETKVTRVDTGIVTDLSGRWNDTDSQMVAETMVKEALANPWLGNFKRARTGSRSSSSGRC